MKYRVCVNDKNYNVLLADIYPDPSQEIEVEMGYHLYRSKILSWNTDLGITSMVVDGVPYDIEIIRNDRGGIEAIIVDNQFYRIDEIQAGKILASRAKTEVVKEGVVKAFMPGLIVRVLKKEGETVEEGETVLYMEAMKMENAILAPRGGVLIRVAPGEGDTVLTGDLLFAVE